MTASEYAELAEAYEDEELVIAEEEAELRLTRKDGEFDGTEAQWRELSDNQQFSLALAAVNRKRTGLKRWLAAEEARELELAHALSQLSLPQVLQALHSQSTCRRWLFELQRCDGCQNGYTQFPVPKRTIWEVRQVVQRNLQVGDKCWELQALGTCEHRNPMGLFLYGLGHRSRGCRVCPPAELSIAEHVQQLFPGSLSQPVQKYMRAFHGEALCCVSAQG